MLNGSNNEEEFSLKNGQNRPGSAPEWGSGGRRFKSAHPDHFLFQISGL
jgi:hypothetical protein